MPDDGGDGLISGPEAQFPRWRCFATHVTCCDWLIGAQYMYIIQ